MIKKDYIKNYIFQYLKYYYGYNENFISYSTKIDYIFSNIRACFSKDDFYNNLEKKYQIEINNLLRKNFSVIEDIVVFIQNHSKYPEKGFIKEKVIEIIKNELSINDEYKIDLDSRIDNVFIDNNGDSLEKVTVILSLENEFNLFIHDEDSEKWNNINDIVNFIYNEIHEFNKDEEEYNQCKRKCDFFNDFYFENNNDKQHQIFDNKILPMFHKMYLNDVREFLIYMSNILNNSNFKYDDDCLYTIKDEKFHKIFDYCVEHSYKGVVYTDEELHQKTKKEKMNSNVKIIKAIVTTSANPFHYGHLDLYNKAKEIFPDVKVVIAQNSDKSQSVNLKEHMDCYDIPYEIIENETIADYCKENGITHIVRGIRNGVDAEYELKMDFVNKEINSDVQTIFIPTSDTYSNISSSTIRELLKYKKYDIVKKFMREDAMVKYIHHQHLDDDIFFKKMVKNFEKRMEEGY